MQLVPGQATLDPILTPERQRVIRTTATQQVFGEIEPRVWEPLRAGHPVAVEQGARAARALHPAELPHQ